MNCLRQPPKVLIVSSSPIYASGLLQLIEHSPTGIYSELFLDPQSVTSAADSPSEAVILAPRDWREMSGWIGPLQKRLPLAPWVVLAELRMAGLFLPRLAAQPCLVVDPTGAPEHFCTSLRAAAQDDTGSREAALDDCWHLPTHLLSLFARSAGFRANGWAGRMPPVVELAISCGVSLDLGNREIAAALHVSEATVKTHLHRLTSRLGLPSRARLGAFIGKALAGQPPLPELDSSRLALSH